MPESNNQRTTSEWLQIIYQENEEAHRNIGHKMDNIEAKLDKKSDKTENEKLEKRIDKVETRTRNIEIKQAGIAAGITSIGLWIKSLFF